MRTCRNAPRRGAGPRRGAAIVFVVVLVPVLLGMAALTIDVGHMYNVRAQLQHAADAASLGVAGRLNRGDSAADLRKLAEAIAAQNHPGHGNIVQEFTLGHWDTDTQSFVAGGVPEDAVRIVTARDESTGGPVGLFFAGLFGKSRTNASARSTGAAPFGPPKFGVRFLIDNEMFDPSLPEIKDYGDDNGMSPDKMLMDGDGDGYIDMPPGILELPTGQVGDEGLFDIGVDFEFTSTSSPSVEDFLLFEEGGDQHGILKSDMDPLQGVEPVSDPARYPEFVNPYQALVSPLYKSDVSYTDPGVNALGERRGLVAFKILGVGKDPDGAGSRLPNLIVEILDPSILNPLSDAELVAGGNAGIGMTQIVE